MYEAGKVKGKNIEGGNKTRVEMIKIIGETLKVEIVKSLPTKEGYIRYGYIRLYTPVYI